MVTDYFFLYLQTSQYMDQTELFLSGMQRKRTIIGTRGNLFRRYDRVGRIGNELNNKPLLFPFVLFPSRKMTEWITSQAKNTDEAGSLIDTYLFCDDKIYPLVKLYLWFKYLHIEWMKKKLSLYNHKIVF